MAAVGKVLALYNHQAVLGPYRTSPVTRHEKLIGSLLQAELSAMLASTNAEIRVYRELGIQTDDEQGGAIDIALMHKVNDGEVPLAIFELTRQSARDKTTQVWAYARNVLVALQPHQFTPLVGVILSNLGSGGDYSTIQITVLGYHFVGEMVLGEVTIFEGTLTVTVLAHLIASLIEYSEELAAAAVGRVEPEPSNSLLQRRIVFHRDQVLKVFDSRYSLVQSPRSPIGYCWLDGAVVEELTDGLTIVRYPHIDGKHVPTRTTQVVNIIRQLGRLHDASWCHGDIRAANLVFGESKSSIIDFDMSRLLDDTNKMRQAYPLSYNCTPGDVIRHPEAKPAAAMALIHDRHALHSILSVSSKNQQWQEAIKKLNDPAVPLASIASEIECLQAVEFDCRSFEQLVERLTRQDGVQLASGSPPKKTNRSQ